MSTDHELIMMRHSTFRAPGTVLVLIFFALSSASFFSPCDGSSILFPAQPLYDGQSLVSPGGSFELGFFSPNRSTKRYVGIWFHGIPFQTVVWVANRKNPVTSKTRGPEVFTNSNTSNGTLSITGNGTLVISDELNSIALWSSSGSAGLLHNPIAQLLEDGNFVVKEADSNSGSDEDSGGFAWQSFDYPTDTLISNMKLGVNLRTGLIRNITAWASESDPSPSNITMTLDLHGYPQLLLWDGPTLRWRGGPWNGQRFSGAPAVDDEDILTDHFVVNSEEIYYKFKLIDPSIFTRLLLDPEGIADGIVWINRTMSWSSYSYAPRDVCDNPTQCGPNSICNPNDALNCNCMQGFRPKNPGNWAVRVWGDGCTRKTELDCKNGTDGFMRISGAKLPDTSNASADMSLDFGNCAAVCLKNCSCGAYASANISSGIGCIFWTIDLRDVRVYDHLGQDLYVRLAAADLEAISASHRSRKNKVIIISTSLVSGVSAFILVAACLMKRRHISIRSSSKSNRGEVLMREEEEMELPLFEFKNISAATENFCNDLMLGKGGFGFVYRGVFSDGKEIAVKRLSRTSLQGIEEFKNEVTLIAKLQHRNLVRLLGCCIEGEERMLVYEYMPNRSLDAILFYKDKQIILAWETRHSIIMGIARGLLYLHQDSNFRIIHRDLKASNILLDEQMNPKISDFGVARMLAGDDAMNITRKVVGTYGYMAPEYAMSGFFSVKSDVFSFGVLVLEVISGEKNKPSYHYVPQNNLLGRAWRLWSEGRSLELVDPSIGPYFDISKVMRCIHVGLLCVQALPEDRPTMSNVVTMLVTDNLILPEPKESGFLVVTRTDNGSPSPSDNQEDVHSVSYMSATMVVGR